VGCTHFKGGEVFVLEPYLDFHDYGRACVFCCSESVEGDVAFEGDIGLVIVEDDADFLASVVALDFVVRLIR